MILRIFFSHLSWTTRATSLMDTGSWKNQNRPITSPQSSIFFNITSLKSKGRTDKIKISKFQLAKWWFNKNSRGESHNITMKETTKKWQTQH